MFTEYIVKWDLQQDGEPIRTHSSRLLPVRRYGIPAMLKVAQEPEEKFGARLMVWWDGEGAARVLAHDADALLLERTQSSHTLADLARTGNSDADDRAIDENRHIGGGHDVVRTQYRRTLELAVQQVDRRDRLPGLVGASGR